jgi:hypothetical protein
MYLECGLVRGHGCAVRLISPSSRRSPLLLLAPFGWGDELWSSAYLSLFGYLWLVLWTLHGPSVVSCEPVTAGKDDGLTSRARESVEGEIPVGTLDPLHRRQGLPTTRNSWLDAENPFGSSMEPFFKYLNIDNLRF